jgi:predicted aldo/keto reductase-like oxidoreductase
MMTDEKNRLNRRSFLRWGAAGLAGLCVNPAAGNRQEAQKPEVKTAKDRFIHRTLGKTGLKLPIVSMGVMNSDNPNLVRAALDRGIVLLDTAHGYQRGRNETMIGEVVKGRPRDSYLIATKVSGAGRERRSGDFSPESTTETFLEMFDTSLRRLGLDYVDILHVHDVSSKEQALFEPILKGLQTAKKSGKARFIGVSTHGGQTEVLRAVVEGKVHDVVLAAYNFRQNNREEMGRAIAEAAHAGVGIIAMKTQAGRFWDREKQQPINMKAALKWVLNNPNVTTAIPGMTTFDQLEDDLAVMGDLTLTEQEKQDLRLETTSAGFYCQQCGQCLSACREGLPVPSLMRSYMYAYGYGNLGAAYDLLQEIDAPQSACQSCSTCVVRCVNGLDVADRVRDIVRLKAMPADFFA